MLEIGCAGPSLQGLPQELKIFIARKLNQKDRKNLRKTCKEFDGLLQNDAVSL